MINNQGVASAFKQLYAQHKALTDRFLTLDLRIKRNDACLSALEQYCNIPPPPQVITSSSSPKPPVVQKPVQASSSSAIPSSHVPSSAELSAEVSKAMGSLDLFGANLNKIMTALAPYLNGDEQ